MNKVLESAKYVAEQSNYVSINREKIKAFCSEFDAEQARHWWLLSPLDLSDFNSEQKIFFLLIVDSISFSYWNEPTWNNDTRMWEEKIWTGKYRNHTNNGAWGLVANLAKAIMNGEVKMNCDFLLKMNEVQLAKILNGNQFSIPMFYERLNIIHNIGKIIKYKFEGKALNLIKNVNGSAEILLEKIINNFPYLADMAIYGNETIFFYKKAQLLTADIIYHLNKEAGILKDELDYLTGIADYKIPQVLRNLGILEYSTDLSHKIDHKIILTKNSKEEIEIRANTIWAIELIKEELKSTEFNISAVEINDYLWLLGQNDKYRDKPYHRCRTINY